MGQKKLKPVVAQMAAQITTCQRFTST